jgi:predicted NACHT family NTPase
MALTVDHQHYDWWYALVAGLTERWVVEQDFGDLSSDFLKGLVAFDLANPVFSSQDGAERRLVHPWKGELLSQRPELVRDAYIAVVRARFSTNQPFADGLRELLTEAPFEPYRKDVALQLLRDFPNANLIHLGELLDAVAQLPAAQTDLILITEQVISGTIVVDERQRDMWLATAYLLSPSRYEGEVDNRTRERPGIVFDLRDRSGFAFRGKPQETTLPMLVFIAQLTGKVYPETPYPEGGSWGDTNPWNATEYCRRLIDTISAMPGETATNALVRLETNPELASYRPHILHALANQRQRRRDAEYDRPDWPLTVRALDNGAPATVADLQ